MRRRLAAILAADMVGYSRLVARDESGTIERQKQLQSTLIDPKVEHFGGRVFKTTGDGLLAEFPSALDAVRCAIDIQSTLPERESDLPADSRIRYRIGINLGDIVPDESDILGDGVNIAARLEGLAEPGGICVSDVVYQNMQGKLEVPFENCGEQALKNMTRKVRVWKWHPPLSSVTGDEVGSATPQEASEKPAVAVLSFASLSDDPDQEYFADGITEDIITELSRYRNFFVIAHNSTSQFRRRAADPGEVASSLGARFVVEGSIRKAGSRVRVTVQLIEAESGTRLWAERYDRDLSDIFAVQDEITQAIAAALPGQVDAAVVERGRKRPTDSLSAYDHLLRGEWHLQLGGIGDGDALAHFEKAAEIDPNSARAHARIAAWYGYSLYESSGDAATAIRKSRSHAERALQLDGSDARVHAIAAAAYLHLGEFELTEQHMAKAMTLNPNDVEVLYRMGMAATYHGDPQTAIEWLQKSMRLDPLFPEFRYEILFDAYYMSGDYESAVQLFRKWHHPPAHMYAEHAAALAQKGDQGAASAALATYRQLSNGEKDIQEFIERHLRICRKQSDKEHWREGYRKAGVSLPHAAAPDETG